MNLGINDCYKNQAILVEDGIPVFSKTDFYVENYDRISADHLKHFDATGHNPFMPEDHWRELEKSTETLVNKYATEPGIKILDVGVGMGCLLERFPMLSRFGMDISRGYLKHARAKGIEVCLSRIEEMPYKERYFDMLVTTDVLEHVLDLNIAVREILGVVKDGGIIIVRVPYKEDLGLYLQKDFPYDLVHLRNFDENNLRLLFEKVFNVHVLEFSFAGYKYGRLKAGAGIRYYRGVVRLIINIARVFSENMYDYLSRKLIQSVEINVVIRNSKKDPTRTE